MILGRFGDEFGMIWGWLRGDFTITVFEYRIIRGSLLTPAYFVRSGGGGIGGGSKKE